MFVSMKKINFQFQFNFSKRGGGCTNNLIAYIFRSNHKNGRDVLVISCLLYVHERKPYDFVFTYFVLRCMKDASWFFTHDKVFSLLWGSCSSLFKRALVNELQF